MTTLCRLMQNSPIADAPRGSSYGNLLPPRSVKGKRERGGEAPNPEKKTEEERPKREGGTAQNEMKTLPCPERGENLPVQKRK